MNWSAVEAITAVTCALAALISGYSTLTVKAAMEKLRADLAEGRAKDREEMREWINGSFMRARVAEAEIRNLNTRVEHTEMELRRIAA